MNQPTKRKVRRIPPKVVCPMTIPLEFNADKLLEDQGVSETVKKSLKASCYYILNTIIKRGEARQAKDNFEDTGYYRLSSKILNKVCGKRYVEALKLLHHHRVIEIDNKYSPGDHSKGYRISGLFSGETKVREMPDVPLKYRVLSTEAMMAEQNNTELSKLPHISKWFDPDRLKIDVDGAHDYIEFYRRDIIKRTEQDNPAHLEKLKNKAIYRYNNSIESIRRIDKGDFNLSRTGKDNRLHSSVSNLKKELRSFLTYDGKPLVGIDIKSSQPYLFTQLLSRETYENSELGLDIPSLYPELAESIHDPTYKNMLDDILMCGDYKQGTDNQSVVSKFSQVNWTEDFYTELMNLESETFGTSKPVFKDRSTAKKLMMIILYSKDFSKKHYPAVIRFEKLFPMEAQLIELFNKLSTKDNENYLPILLQRIESRIILDLVCKEIHDKLPQAPLIPIHDSILTTPEHADHVKEIMESAISRITGFPVGLKIEDLSVKKALHELSQTVDEDYNELKAHLQIDYSVKEKHHLINRIPRLGGRQILSTRYLSNDDNEAN